MSFILLVFQPRRCQQPRQDRLPVRDDGDVETLDEEFVGVEVVVELGDLLVGELPIIGEIAAINVAHVAAIGQEAAVVLQELFAVLQ